MSSRNFQPSSNNRIAVHPRLPRLIILFLQSVVWGACTDMVAALRNAMGSHTYAEAMARIVARFLDGVVLDGHVKDRVQRLMVSTRNARQNNAPLRNALFFGPPGTGKTLVAQRLARACGLDFAIMSGGDVAPLGRHAVTELHNLFAWAKSSRRGLLLFIDEADAFLGKRDR